MFKNALEDIRPYRVPTPPHRIKLNQNESPHELPARLRARILARMRTEPWSRYPAFPPETLRRLLAGRLGLPESGVLLGNGSNELILSVALATLSKGGRMLTCAPSFALFERVAMLCEGRTDIVPLREDFSHDVDALCKAAARASTRLVLLASPNNPTGTALRPEELRRIADSTDALVLLDEAYHEFADEDHRVALKRSRNLVITRTFSKAYALAGLRLGYACGRSAVIAKLELATLPFNIDRFSQIAGEEIMAEPELALAKLDAIRRERHRLERALSALPKVRVTPSQANFVLARFADARRVWRALLERGILVRDVSAGPGLADCLRITVGKRADNSELIRSLKEICR